MSPHEKWATDFTKLTAEYVAFHSARGNDPQVGLQLSGLASAAGLEVSHFKAWFDISEAPVGRRPPSWATREEMVAAGLASEADITPWNAAFDDFDKAPKRPLIFPALFAVVARRPQ